MDKEAALKLAELAGVNTEEFAQKMFEAGSDFENKTENEILNQDFKIFHSGDISFGVAQISAMSRTELDRVQIRVMPCLKELLVEKKLDMVFIMLTDILSESTNLVFEGEDAEAVVRDAYGSAPQDGVLLKGVVSRKKQLIPTLMNALAER
jgi:manganese-dependent inorganic pyrophosphatase